MSAEKQLVGQAKILLFGKAPSPWATYLLLALPFFSIEVFWSCVVSQVPPFLLGQGMSRSAVAVVLLSGPMSGLIFNPITGAVSDQCCSRYGRRRPFILGGCLLSIFAMMLLSRSQNLAAMFLGEESDSYSSLACFFAVVGVYLEDIGINAIQVSCQLLLIDLLSAEEQPSATAWTSVLLSLGMVFGLFVNSLDLVNLTGRYIGSNQIQVVMVISSSISLTIVLTLIMSVKERVQIQASRTIKESKLSLHYIFSKAKLAPNIILDVWDSLGWSIQRLFIIQAASWFAFSPIMHLASPWVAEVYTRSQGYHDLSTAPFEIREKATQASSGALFYHGIVTFLSSLIIPFVIERIAAGHVMHDVEAVVSAAREKTLLDLILRFWMVADVGLFGLLLSAWIASVSVGSQTIFLVLAGLARVFVIWAPGAVLNMFIMSRRGGHGIHRYEHPSLALDTLNAPVYMDPSELGHGHSESVQSSTPFLPEETEDSNQEGFILGLNNIAIVIPQIAVMAVSSAVFKGASILSGPDAKPTSAPYNLIFSISSFGALACSYRLLKMARERG